MNIIYPPLVEQCYDMFFKYNDEVSKTEVYQFLINNQFINNNGSPTQMAIDNQWIQEYVEDQNLSFDEFLLVYPVFQKFNRNAFKLKNGFWEITPLLKEYLKQFKHSRLFNYQEQIQVQAFLSAQLEEEDLKDE
mgnify:CR=1 FL=1